MGYHETHIGDLERPGREVRGLSLGNRDAEITGVSQKYRPAVRLYLQASAEPKLVSVCVSKLLAWAVE
jgi:hypothetical protein